MIVQGFTPRPSQRELLQSKARFIAACCGRRWGKSLTGLNWLQEGNFNEGGQNWWVSPVYAQARAVYRRLLNACHKFSHKIIRYKSDSELLIEWMNRSTLFFKSADRYENLRGEGLKRVVMDEAARQRRAVWEEIIRPAVSDTGGRVMFITTPKGKNWFFELYNRGHDPLYPEYASFTFPTADNPLVMKEDIEEAKRNLPLDVFEQEYLATFLESAAGVFRNFRRCMTQEMMDPIRGLSYVIGLDLAKHTDFSVLSVFNQLGEQVYLERFNQLDYTFQEEKIRILASKYNDAMIVMDVTGVGEPVFDALCNTTKLDIHPYLFTNDSKRELIQHLMLAFEQENIKILSDKSSEGRLQANELDIFEYRMNDIGRVFYSAPSGYHDDIVVATALANYGLMNYALPLVAVTEKSIY